MTTLLDGRVLVSGGNFFGGTGNFFGGNFGNTPTCELYVPATSSFTATGTMVHARGEHRASLLPSGRVGPPLSSHPQKPLISLSPLLDNQP